jgi:thiol-disulfide isomerase/thioredoxin
MLARLSIVAGLVAGIAVAAIAIGGILAFAPLPSPSPTPAPSIAIPSPSSPSTEVPSMMPSASAPTATGGSAEPGSPEPSDEASPAESDEPVGDLPFHVGQPAPALVVPQVGGGTIDLAALKGKPVWVNFMGTYCPPCQDEFPLMNGFAARYEDTGLVVIAVDVKEAEPVVRAFADQLHVIFPMGLDADGSVSDAWDASAALPIHFWIDSAGIIRDGASGGIGPDIMADGLQTILPGVVVTPS